MFGMRSSGLFRVILAFVMSVICVLPSASIAEESSFRGWWADYAEPEKKWGLFVFGGQMSDRSLGGTIEPLNGSDRTSIYFAGVALNRYIGHWHAIGFEAEGGLGYQFAQGTENDTGQVWGALYARYDNFPWNDLVKTSIAINTGLNYAFQETEFEESFSSEGTRKLMHYLAPEITFAAPGYEDFEAVFRLHHRSAVFGLMGCTGCRNNMVSFGIRGKF